MTRQIPERERFLSRWSRLKRAPAGGAENVAAAVAVPAAVPGAAPSLNSSTTVKTAAPALPDIASLTMQSDYAPFFQPKVPEALRRAAVKKLFADPHFNVMDGLDTYIDDYSKFEPIPPEMLARLVQARDIIDHPSNAKVENAEQTAAMNEENPVAQVEQPGAMNEGNSVAQLEEQPEAGQPALATEAPLKVQPPVEDSAETATADPIVPDPPRPSDNAA